MSVRVSSLWRHYSPANFAPRVSHQASSSWLSRPSGKTMLIGGGILTGSWLLNRVALRKIETMGLYPLHNGKFSAVEQELRSNPDLSLDKLTETLSADEIRSSRLANSLGRVDR